MRSINTLALFSLFFLTPISYADTTTVIDPNTPPAQNTTVVWSPLFQASWDLLNSRRKGKLVKVEPENKLMTTLDKFKWQEKEVMPEGGYAVFAGPATVEFGKQVSEAVAKQFGYQMQIDMSEGPPRGDVVYGVLVRDLNFKKQFYSSTKKSLSFYTQDGKQHEVKFFGTAKSYSNRYGGSVEVLSYKDQGKSFTLSIETDQDKEQLIIYKPAYAMSFQQAIDQVIKAKKSPLKGKYGSINDSHLHKNDIIQIPYVHLDEQRDFIGQLGGLRYYSKEPEPWTIFRAIQITKFDLTEKGARIRVETGAGGAPFGEAPPKPLFVPRQFICNQPFFIFAWKEEAKLPYFGTWVNSIDVLRPMNR